MNLPIAVAHTGVGNLIDPLAEGSLSRLCAIDDGGLEPSVLSSLKRAARPPSPLPT
jgi:hypothetical protein